MRFLLLFCFVASIIRCRSLPIKVLSDLPWGDDSSLATALTRVKKDADSIAYLEECAVVESWQEQPGFINVLAFLDASWEYSHRQATMLETLQGRLERSGITGVKFFVINSAHPEAAANMVDVEDEKEAWGAVEFTDRAFTEIEQTRDALKAKIGPDIGFVQDTNELKIWEKLAAARDQVLVIDKCGRLSYRVIVPWSILHFPYVKAAILSTYKEQPCGRCDLETTTAAVDAETQTEELTEMLPKEFNVKQIEEIAAKKYNLDESDNAAKKLHHGAGYQDIPENVIRLLNESANMKHEKGNANFTNDTKTEKLILKQSWNFDDVSYSQAPNPIKENSGNNENRHPPTDEDTLYNNSSSTIINESIEHEISNNRHNDSERSQHLGNKIKVDNSESIDSTNLTNIPQNSMETDNSMRSNESGDGYIDDNSSDSEESNTSASLSEDQTENRIITSTEDDSESADYVMPMRIIMHAPHIHEHEEPRKKYEYLVLKFGDPEYHKHLEYDDDFVSTESDANFEKDHDSRNGSDTHEEIDEAELGSGEVSGNEDGKKHRHHSDGHGHKHTHKKSKAEYVVYDKDESPGFYGEDAEYWRNFGNSKYQEPFQIEESVEKAEEHEKDSEMELEGFYVVNITEKNENNSTSIFESSREDVITEKHTSRYENFQTNIHSAEPNEGRTKEEEFSDDEQVGRNNTEEDEVAKHLIEHYSKLIPWLDYVMND